MSVLETLSRKAILSITQNGVVRRVAGRHGMKLGASRFVAGETLETALRAVAELNAQGILATLDHLGEFVADNVEAAVATEACIHTLDGIHKSRLQCNLSLKLTQLGLDLDYRLCQENMRQILTRAATYDNFVRIDMEDTPRTDTTLKLLAELQDEFGVQRVGTVIQAYLYRSQQDLEQLADRGVGLRLVKGAYLEPAHLAFPKKADVDANYLKLIEYYLGRGQYTAIATHDETMIQATKQFVANKGIAKDQFEFQMLYGIRRDLQKQLVQEGYRMRVYVPFGTDWYGYFTRRLAERPANVMFVLGNMLKP